MTNKQDNKLSGSVFLNDILGLVQSDNAGTLKSVLIAHPDLIAERDGNGRTALHHAAEDGVAGCLDALLTAGADPNATDVAGETPLHRALTRGRVEATHILLGSGADPNAASVHGITPVLLAAGESNSLFLTVLAAGGDIDARDGFGRSAKDWSDRASLQNARRPPRPA